MSLYIYPLSFSNSNFRSTIILSSTDLRFILQIHSLADFWISFNSMPPIHSTKVSCYRSGVFDNLCFFNFLHPVSPWHLMCQLCLHFTLQFLPTVMSTLVWRCFLKYLFKIFRGCRLQFNWIFPWSLSQTTLFYTL